MSSNAQKQAKLNATGSAWGQFQNLVNSRFTYHAILIGANRRVIRNAKTIGR